MGVASDGRPQGPTPRILSPLYLSPRQGSPTIRRIGPPRRCIVGTGEDVDVGMGPSWLPVRTHHRLSSPYLKGIGPLWSPVPFHHRSTFLFLVKRRPIWIIIDD